MSASDSVEVAARPLAVGDVFCGTNKRGPARWTTRCTATASEEGRVFAFDKVATRGSLFSDFQRRNIAGTAPQIDSHDGANMRRQAGIQHGRRDMATARAGIAEDRRQAAAADRLRRGGKGKTRHDDPVATLPAIKAERFGHQHHADRGIGDIDDMLHAEECLQLLLQLDGQRTITGNGGSLRIVAASRQVRRVLEVTGAGQVLGLDSRAQK